MKVGYFTDPHARYDTPEGRVDNFNIAIKEKLIETGTIFNDNNVDVILTGGDLFNSPDVPNTIIYSIMGILQEYNAPIIGTIGSHDYFGYQMKSFNRTAMGILHKAGIMQVLVGESEYDLPNHKIITLPNGFKLGVVATHHTYWLAQDPNNYHRDRLPEVHLQIQLTHGDLQDKPVPWDHVLIDDVTTESDIVMGAHYHPGWGTVSRNINGREVRFINPGAIARLENTGVHRIPKVVIIDIDEATSTYTVSEFELQSAAPHPFKDRGKIAEESPMQDIQKLMSLIENTNITTLDIKLQLPKIAKELKLSDEVLDIAFECLNEVEKKEK